MGFADAYLLKAGLRESLIQTDPHSDLKIIVAIPANNESGLERCLDSLFMSATLLKQAAGSSVHAEVLILVNAAADAPSAILDQNLSTLSQAEDWIAGHPHPFVDFHIWLDHSFGKKEAGVGTARKILMDEAARRFNRIGNASGVIACFDADALVDPNYFRSLATHFFAAENSGDDPRGPNGLPGAEYPEGCSIYFEHPLEGSLYPRPVYEAIIQYELHLRYYLEALRSTTYPHAYHTVGSSFAVRASVYCLEGGMNRRKAGEDFYFIQKLAQRGQWSECNATRVIPSPRPSDRVPFGTGRAVKDLLRDADPSGKVPALKTYHQDAFEILRRLFLKIDDIYAGPFSMEALPEVLVLFLEAQEFTGAMEEIRSNTSSTEAFRKRFWRWFNMFRIMKFLHHAREQGYPDVEVGVAAQGFLSLEMQHSNRDLLEIFRKRQRV